MDDYDDFDDGVAEYLVETEGDVVVESMDDAIALIQYQHSIILGLTDRLSGSASRMMC